MAPQMSVWPRGGPVRGGTPVLVRLDGDESWTSSTALSLVFGTRIRRIPVSAKLGKGGRNFVTCTCIAPRWGEQEVVHVILVVNKIEAASASFFFYLPLKTTLAKPHMARCSQKTNITLSGENFPGAPGRGGAGGMLPVAGETVDVRLVAESGELLFTEKGLVGNGTVTVELGGIAMTGAVHFEVSVNGADFDATYSEWQEQARLLASGPVQRQKAAAEIAQLESKMQRASVVLWENPLLAGLEPAFLYVGASAEATLRCTGYPVVATGSVVVNLAERDVRSGDHRLNHDVPGEADVASNTIRFVTPKFQAEKRHEVDVEVCVSLDGGRTFSALCPQRIRVRRKPYVAKVSPLCAPCSGGTRVTVVGDSLYAKDPGAPILVRFKGQQVDQRVEALGVRAAAEGADGEAGWMEVECIIPSMKELEKAGVVPLQVSLSMDGGGSWAVWEGGLFRVYPPVALSQVKPKTIVMGGGTPLFVYGTGLFQTSALAIQLSPAGDEQEVQLLSRTVAVPAKFQAVKQAAAASSPELAFTGPAMVMLTLNGQQWYPAPDIVTVRRKPVEPLTREQVVEKEREKEKERAKRIRERAEALGSSSKLPPGMAVREAVKDQVSKMLGVGIRLGRNSKGEHCIVEVRKGAKALAGGLQVGDVVAAVREVRGDAAPSRDDTVYLNRDVDTIDAAVLLRGPPGSVLGLVLPDGSEILLKREYADRDWDKPTGAERGSQSTSQSKTARTTVGMRGGPKAEAAGGVHNDPIARSALLKGRKHYEKLQVPGHKKGKLRELALSGIGEVTQWTVVCALLTQKTQISGADLEAFGIERPAIAPIVPKKSLDEREHPRAKKAAGVSSMAKADARLDSRGGHGSGRAAQGESGRGAEERGEVVRTQLQLELPNGARYEGESVAGVAEGRGQMRFANGDAYRGEFLGGTMHGDGEWAYVGGDVYRGRFQNGMAEGAGRFEGASGDVYEGEYAANRPHGWGLKLWKNGCRYEGEWKRGKEHGNGQWSLNGDRYDGDFRDGVPHGEGRFVKANGDVYQGQWRQGKQHGRGAYFGKDGEVYDGEWCGGRICRAGLHKRKQGKRGTEEVLGVYKEKWEDDEEEEPQAEVLQRLRDRELRDDAEGFLRAVGKVFRERVEEYLRAGIDASTALPLETFRDAPWWRPPMHALRDLQAEQGVAGGEGGAEVSAVEVLCLVWLALETGQGDPGSRGRDGGGGGGAEGRRSVENADGTRMTLEESVGGLRGVSRGMLVDTLKELLAAGADPTGAMAMAAENGEIEVARLLVERCGVRAEEVGLPTASLVGMAEATLQTAVLEGVRGVEQRARQLVVYLESWGEAEGEGEGQTPRGGGEGGWGGVEEVEGAGDEGKWRSEADGARAMQLMEEVEGELPADLTLAVGRAGRRAAENGHESSRDEDATAAAHMAGADSAEEEARKLALSGLRMPKEEMLARGVQTAGVEALREGVDLNSALVVVVEEVQLEGAAEVTVKRLAQGRGRVGGVYLGMEALGIELGDGQEEGWWSHSLPAAGVLIFQHEMVLDLHPDTAPSARRAVARALGGGEEGELALRVMLCGELDNGPGAEVTSESGKEELDAIELAGSEVNAAREGRAGEGMLQQVPLTDGERQRVGLVSLRVHSDKAMRAVRRELLAAAPADAGAEGGARESAGASARASAMPLGRADRWVPGVGVADGLLGVAEWRDREAQQDAGRAASRFESLDVRAGSSDRRGIHERQGAKGATGGPAAKWQAAGGLARREQSDIGSGGNGKGGVPGPAERGRVQASEAGAPGRMPDMQELFDDLYLGGSGFL